MKEIKNFVVFNTLIKHGQMNSGKAFYPGLEDNASERTRLMREHKQAIADEVGFDINHIFMSLQANAKHPYVPGTSYTITPEDVASYNDLYDYAVWSDTIKLTRNTPQVVIGFNVSDGANVIAMNLKTKEATSTFCSGAHINKRVPFTIASQLGGNPEDIMVDVSPFLYTYPFMIGELSEPSWVSNEQVWEKCIGHNENEKDLLMIDQRKALLRQLEESGIRKENIHLRGNTIFDPDYYSSQMPRFNERLKTNRVDGRFMHAVMFELEGEEREYDQPYIKKYSTK